MLFKTHEEAETQYKGLATAVMRAIAEVTLLGATRKGVVVGIDNFMHKYGHDENTAPRDVTSVYLLAMGMLDATGESLKSLTTIAKKYPMPMEAVTMIHMEAVRMTEDAIKRTEDKFESEYSPEALKLREDAKETAAKVLAGIDLTKPL